MRDSCAQVQLARYAPGTRYIRHTDATASHAPERRLTLLLYLNPDWAPGDGGELRIFADDIGVSRSDCLLRSAPSSDDPPPNNIDVEPRGNRLLVFQSRSVPHEVLRTSDRLTRYSLTVWAY